MNGGPVGFGVEVDLFERACVGLFFTVFKCPLVVVDFVLRDGFFRPRLRSRKRILTPQDFCAAV